MRADLLFRFDASYDRYIPVLNEDTLTYTLSGGGKAFLVPVSGGTINLLTREPLSVGDQVRNVLDRDGNEVFVVGGVSYPMYVTAATPQMGPPFGVILGWSHSLKRELPRNLNPMIDALTERIQTVL